MIQFWYTKIKLETILYSNYIFINEDMDIAFKAIFSKLILRSLLK